MFYIGVLMIFYDLLGHYICLLARLGIGTEFINKYGRYMYLSFPNPIHYDFFWIMFFIIALLLIILGRNKNER